VKLGDSIVFQSVFHTVAHIQFAIIGDKLRKVGKSVAASQNIVYGKFFRPYYRVYLDNKLIWGTRKTFFGGHFELHYQSNAPLKINRISIYDTGFVQPGEKRKSRLQLPQ